MEPSAEVDNISVASSPQDNSWSGFALFLFLFFLLRFSWSKWQCWQLKPLRHRPLGWKQQRSHVPLKWLADPMDGSSEYHMPSACARGCSSLPSSPLRWDRSSSASSSSAEFSPSWMELQSSPPLPPTISGSPGGKWSESSTAFLKPVATRCSVGRRGSPGGYRRSSSDSFSEVSRLCSGGTSVCSSASLSCNSSNTPQDHTDFSSSRGRSGSAGSGIPKKSLEGDSMAPLPPP
mmetsp:Transcript_56685/g.159933  ORF Transcript_56685/g.159933 Transcript_56685/m.159933 type:complete len:234 (+) Transcript_56685:1020-1721(+)